MRGDTREDIGEPGLWMRPNAPWRSDQTSFEALAEPITGGSILGEGASAEAFRR